MIGAMVTMAAWGVLLLLALLLFKWRAVSKRILVPVCLVGWTSAMLIGAIIYDRNDPPVVCAAIVGVVAGTMFAVLLPRIT